MKKAILFAALAIAMGAQAEPTDSLDLRKDSIVTDSFTTTLGKKVVVNDSLNCVNVDVYQQDGTALHKVYEVSLEGEQEVSRMYVSSPFLPNSWGNVWTQTEDCTGVHLPSFYMTWGSLRSGAFSVNQADNLHINSGGEWGLTTFDIGFPLNKKGNLLIGTGLRAGYMHMNFANNAYTLGTIDGKTTAVPIETTETVKKSYISYWTMGIPFILEYQPFWNGRRSGVFIGAGLELEGRAKAHARYKLSDKNTITNSDINVNSFGLNMTLQMGYKGVMLYGSFGLTPLFKNEAGPKAYTCKLGFAATF